MLKDYINVKPYYMLVAQLEIQEIKIYIYSKFKCSVKAKIPI